MVETLGRLDEYNARYIITKSVYTGPLVVLIDKVVQVREILPEWFRTRQILSERVLVRASTNSQTFAL